ncbi:MAG: CoA transferase [Deltaproteobacteria bacterium]|nr:CoA transferase [Deltaproteobacteria bacterium]
MSGALDGIRVIDTTTMISGPICTRILADQGADVVKVEAPGVGDLVRVMGARRDGLSATFVTSNRNKRSVVIDLKQKEGLSLLERLVATADVFVQNFRPGAAERMGIGEEALRKIRPDLVYCSISGFGEKGPYAHKRVYDPVVQALSGLAAIQADRDTGRPRMVRLIVPDKLTAITAAQAITAALFHRERTGEGQHLRLAMLDAMVAFAWPEGMAGHTFIGEGQRDRRARYAQDLIFETADGYLTAGAVSDSEWKGLCRAIEHEEWLEDPRFETAAGRIMHAGDRLMMTAEVFRARTTAEWLERLEAEDVPSAPVLSRQDLLTHPQLEANELVVESDHPVAGRMRQARPPERFSATPSSLRRPAPSLGEHTTEIFEELGVDAEDLAALRAQGVVA